MRNIGLALIGIYLLSMGSLKAQFTEKLVPHFGFMIERSFIGDRSLWNGTVINGGTYIALFHYNDIISGGIDPSIQASLRFPPGPGVDMLLQAPVYAMVRVGANSTRYNEQAFGISLGAGLNYTTVISTGNKWRVGYTVPEFVGEVTFVSRGSPITGRIHFSPFNPQGTATDGNTYEFNNILGIGLLYGF